MPARNTPSTGPRNNASRGRGTGRGGISKRKAETGRVDKDGDLIMGAGVGSDSKPSGRGRPEGNSLPRGRGATRRDAGSRTTKTGLANAQQAILKGLGAQQANVLESRIEKPRLEEVEILVQGLKDSKAARNADGGLRDLLGFLERKASALVGAPRRGIKIKKSRRKGDDVIVTVTKAEVEWILKVNTFKFAGATLTISESTGDKEVESDMSEEAKNLQEKIRSILSTRYDGNLKLLNLSALGQDPGLKDLGMFDAQNRISKLFPVLMRVCDKLFETPQQKREAIASVTLADNDLEGITQITTLSQTFPDIQNLDLSRNKFAALKPLEGWRWKFRKLQNLQIMDNPIETAEPDYKLELLKWYPELLVLNGIQVRSPEEAEASARSRELVKASPIPIAGPDFRDVNHIGENFIRQFFALYDSDRNSLAENFYDSRSTHSMSVNTSAPRSEDQSKTILSWSAYIKQSRNLLKITTANARISRSYQGVQAIKGLWGELPKTRHPDLGTQTARYIIDCHAIPGLYDPSNPRGVDGMIIMVHGEFDEQLATNTDLVTRSFSRTFILGPGPPGGLALSVISDILVVRAWSPLATAATPDSAVDPSDKVVGPQDALKQQVLGQVIARTGMNVQYATMCLDGTSWDFEQALAAFEANKASLPPEAFTATAV